jgi:hypothetical protein
MKNYSQDKYLRLSALLIKSNLCDIQRQFTLEFRCKLIPAHTRAALTAPEHLINKIFAFSRRAALFMMALILRPPHGSPATKASEREQRTEAQVYSLAACSLNQSTQTFNDFALLWHSLINSRIQAAAKG